MEVTRLEDIEFIFDASEDDGFLDQVSEQIDVKVMETEFKLDTGILYKKGSVGDLSHIFLEKIDSSDKEFTKKLFKGLTFVLLWTIYPKASRFFVSSENDYTEIQKFLHNEMGSQFFYKIDVQTNDVLAKIISSLKVEKLITDIDDKYYLTGYYLDSLKLTNIKE
jgi:hypothetical protein